MSAHILDLFLLHNKNKLNTEQNTTYLTSIRELEQEFLPTLSEEQQKIYKTLKFNYDCHLEEIYYEFMQKVLSFGIIVGMEFQSFIFEE